MYRQGELGTRLRVGLGTIGDEGRVEVGRSTNNDSTNSQLHARSSYNFPFAAPFGRAAWNCQSLFAYGRDKTQYVLDLAAKHDFIGLSETRGTVELNVTHALDGKVTWSLIISGATSISSKAELGF